jgi:hypothetical protein
MKLTPEHMGKDPDAQKAFHQCRASKEQTIRVLLATERVFPWPILLTNDVCPPYVVCPAHKPAHLAAPADCAAVAENNVDMLR